MRLVKLIANLGYGSRKEVTAIFREGRITDVDGEVLYTDDKVEHSRVLLDGQAARPAARHVADDAQADGLHLFDQRSESRRV